MSVIKTPNGMFIVCPKPGGQNVIRPLVPPPVTTVHMQVEQPLPPPKEYSKLHDCVFYLYTVKKYQNQKKCGKNTSHNSHSHF